MKVAKDDYYVIVAKILVYLYKKTKDSKKVEKNYIVPMSKDFPISQEYLFYVIEMLERQGCVEASIIRAWGNEIISIDTEEMRILPDGIDYLQSNTKLKKLCRYLKEAKSIFSLFM